MKSYKKNKGITLIALVITIIILLILAGITIVQLTGNGIFGKSKLENQDTRLETATDNIEICYEGKQIEEQNKLQLLITVKEEENGLDKIEYPDGDILKCNGKNQVGIDYTIENEEEGIFKITSNNGYIKELPINEERVDIFGELQKNEKTVEDFPEYGMTISRSGSNQYNGNELYYLGMGSSTGTHTNKFILTIDYETLISKLDNKQFKGIYGSFSLSASGAQQRPSAWSNSQIIVTYEDGTKSETPQHQIKTNNWSGGETINEEYCAAVFFREDKKISTIEIAINMYDPMSGAATGYILNMDLIK